MDADGNLFRLVSEAKRIELELRPRRGSHNLNAMVDDIVILTPGAA
jgi:hypothetical protein